MESVGTDSQGWFSRIIDSSSISALALLVYEFLLTFDDEVELIWTKPGSSFIKWLFLLMRYFGLTSQIGNHILSLHIASTIPATLHYCRLWYTWRLVSAQIMLAAVETTLILRVYALYNRNRRIAFVLGLLVFTEVTVSGINSYINIPKLQFDDVCLTQLAFLPVIQFGIIALCTQSSILFLTFAKQIFAVRTGWGRTPLVSLMIRDGVFAFVAIFSVLAATLAFMTMPRGLLFIQSWLLTLTSCVGCRLIINMQRLAMPKDQKPTSFEFTTNLTEFRLPPTATTSDTHSEIIA